MPDNDARVLIVEANDVLRVMLFTILRHQPLNVDTAAGAEQALERVRSCDYALILLDMNLPERESERFVSTFREERPEATTFIIAVRDPAQELAIDPGVVSAILNKPLEIDMLAEVVRECAQVVPPPDDPLQCPPSDSEIRRSLDRGGSYLAN